MAEPKVKPEHEVNAEKAAALLANKDVASKIAEIKEQYGIASTAFDRKLELLILAANGSPTAQQILQFIQQQLQPGNLAIRLQQIAEEWEDLFKTGKSVPKKNRSALA